MIYTISKMVVLVLCKIFWRLKIDGQENVPHQGAVLIAANHRSNADPPLVGISLKRSVHFLAKRSLFSFRPLGWFLGKLHAHPLSRAGGAGAIKQAYRLLRQGEAVIVFPEGHRIRTEGLAKPKAGVGMLAMSANVPVVPAYLHNSAQRRLFRRVSVSFGPALQPSGFSSHAEMAEAVMAAIAEQRRQGGHGPFAAEQTR